MENGYLYVSGEWKKGDLLKLRFAMKVKVMQADSRVRQDEGKVAIMRGPVVYCLEEADNGQGLPLVRVKPDAVFTEEKTDELGFTMIMLRVNAKTKKPVTVENGLYQTWQKPEHLFSAPAYRQGLSYFHKHFLILLFFYSVLYLLFDQICNILLIVFGNFCN